MCESELFFHMFTEHLNFPFGDFSAHKGHPFFPNLVMFAEVKCAIFIYFNSNLKILPLFLLKVLSTHQVLQGLLLPGSLRTGFCPQFPAALWGSEGAPHVSSAVRSSLSLANLTDPASFPLPAAFPLGLHFPVFLPAPPSYSLHSIS